MHDISWWFCCLNSRERGVLRATAIAFVDVLFLGIPLSLWLVLCASNGLTSEAMTDAFLAIYNLEIATIPLGEPPVETEVVRPSSLPLWVEYSLFVASPGGACLDGCMQSTLP